MEFDYETAVGLKFFVGPLDLTGKGAIDTFKFMFNSDNPDFIDEMEDPSGVFTGDNIMTCKFFDEEEGVMYVHFDKEVDRENLSMFEDREMIYKKI